MTEEVAKLEARVAELGAKRDGNLRKIKDLAVDKEAAIQATKKLGAQMKAISQENQAIDREAQELRGRIEALPKLVPVPPAAA